MLLLKPAMGSGEEVRFDSVVGSISTESSISTHTVQFPTSSAKGSKSYQKQDGHTEQEQDSGRAPTRSAVKPRVTARGSNPGLPPTLGGILATGQLGKHFNKTKKISLQHVVNKDYAHVGVRGGFGHTQAYTHTDSSFYNIAAFALKLSHA